MSRLVRAYEWAVISVAVMVCLLTGAAIYFQFLDGEILNVPLVYNDPHIFNHPVTEHQDTLSRGITHLTIKPTYKNGETVYAYVDLVKYTDVPGKLQWQLMDQRFYPYVSRTGVLPKGHTHQVVAIEKIPMHVPPGQYHFSGTVSYEVNFMRDIHIPMRTNCFQVVD